MKCLCKKLLKQSICVVLILSLSGCWNSRELNKLAIVRGIGIDTIKEEPGKVQMTVQLVKPQQFGSGSSQNGGGGSEEPFWNVRSTGDTIFSANREMTSKVSRKLFFPHNEILIFGSDTAAGGIQRYLDFFERDHETRVKVMMAVSETSAEDLLDVQAGLEDIPADNIAGLIRQYSDVTSQTKASTIADFADNYMSKTTASVIPLLKTVMDGDKRAIELSGTAVLKSDKMIGKLDKAEGRGLLWVLGKVKSGVIVVKDSQGGSVSAEIIRSKTKMTPVLKDGKIYISVKIKEEGNLGEQSGTEDLSKLTAVTDLEYRISQEIQHEVAAALKKARELDADIFGFGSAIKAKYPSEWKDMEDHWDEEFKNVEVKLSIEASLRLMGRISKPLAPE